MDRAQQVLLDRLLNAVRLGDEAVERAIAYLEAGGDINTIVPESGWSLLHYAAEHRNLGLMETLASRGADLNVRNSEGRTPLHHAVDSDSDGALQRGRAPDFAGARKLVALGAQLDAVDHEGLNPRDFANRYGSDIVHFFDRYLAQS